MSAKTGYPSRQGIEYEISTLAYFALTLYNNNHVENFTLHSNVPQDDFGKFDDIVANITMKNGKKRYFAMQIKHCERESKLSFVKKNGSFKHASMFDSVKNLEKTREGAKKEYKFIIYTNQKENLNTFNNEMEEKKCDEDEFLLTNRNGGQTYKVTNTNFYFYTAQNNNEQTKSEIVGIFETLYRSERPVALAYVDFVRKLHENQFIDRRLDKETLNLHLVDLLLIPDVIPNSLDLSIDEIVIHAYNLGPKTESTRNTIIVGTQSLLLLLEIYIATYEIKVNVSDTTKELLENCCFALGQKFKFIERDKCLNLPPDSGKTKILYYFFQVYLCKLEKRNKIQAIHKVDNLKIPTEKSKLFFFNPTLDQNLMSFLEKITRIVSPCFSDSEIVSLIQAVHFKPIIWDKSLPHRNKESKEEAWQEISEYFTGDKTKMVLKQKWKLLKNDYLKVKRSQGGKLNEFWWGYLNFLDKIMPQTIEKGFVGQRGIKREIDDVEK